MRVTGAKAGEDNLAFICLSVAGGVAHMDEIATVANVRAAMAEGKTGGHIEAIGVGGNFVRPAVALGVLKNEQLVVGLLTRLELRIGPRTQHPQPPARVPAHANGIGNAHRFVGKQAHLQPLVHRKRS